MNIMSAFGDFLSAAQLEGKSATVAIADVKMVDLMDEKTKKVSPRPVVFFNGTARGWILNRTNASAIAAMFGLETNAWAGKRVTLYAADVQFGPERVKGVRVAGSPDLAADLTFELKLPRKKAQKVTLTKTVVGAVPHPAPAVPQFDSTTTTTLPPIIDTETGERF
jgi:hypothetical protein